LLQKSLHEAFLQLDAHFLLHILKFNQLKYKLLQQQTSKLGNPYNNNKKQSNKNNNDEEEDDDEGFTLEDAGNILLVPMLVMLVLYYVQQTIHLH